MPSQWLNMLSLVLIALCLRLILYLKVYLTLYQYNAAPSPRWRHLSGVQMAWKIWHPQQWCCSVSLFWKRWYQFQEPRYKLPNIASQTHKKCIHLFSFSICDNLSALHLDIIPSCVLYASCLEARRTKLTYSLHTLPRDCSKSFFLIKFQIQKKKSWSHVAGLPIVYWRSQCHLNISLHIPDGARETECWKTTISTDQMTLFWTPGVEMPDSLLPRLHPSGQRDAIRSFG